MTICLCCQPLTISRPNDGRSVADRPSLTKATIGSEEVVALKPKQQRLIAFFGNGPVASIGPLAQSGLDEAFNHAIGAWGVGASEAMAKPQAVQALAERVGAIAAFVVGEQGANADAMLGIKSQGVAQVR